MKNIKKEELEKLVGIDKVDISLVKVEKLYVRFILRRIHWDL